MGKILKGIVIVFGLLFLIGMLGGGEDDSGNTAVEAPEVIETAYHSTDGEVEDAVSTPEPETVKASDTEYQDDEWTKNTFSWINVVSSDLNMLSESTNAFNFDYIRDDAHLLEVDCGMALKDSKCYSVSPKLQSAKNEYESGLSAFIKGAEEAQLGVDKTDSGDFEAASTHFTTASTYFENGSGHITTSSRALERVS